MDLLATARSARHMFVAFIYLSRHFLYCALPFSYSPINVGETRFELVYQGSSDLVSNLLYVSLSYGDDTEIRTRDFHLERVAN